MFKLKSLSCIGFKRLKISKPIEFPDSRLLIYGRNESGKSTIMEAIHYALYGQGLRPNRRASNDDLINYNLSRAVVELKFSIDDNLYTVRRILRRRGANRHEVLIERSDGTKQMTSGALNVNKVIEQELYGIDSDALLNSCLVEQKELGKLESATRSDRIQAMTSLLNIETFVKSQQEINKEKRKLELANVETVGRLEKAANAKNLYDVAQEKFLKAQARIKIIKQELVDRSEKIDKLDIIIASIDKIKRFDNEIKELEAKLEGRQREKKRVRESLKEAIESEELVRAIKKELPPSRSKLNEEKRKVEAFENVLKLQNQIYMSTKEGEIVEQRLKEASKKLDDAKIAKERVDNLNIKIQNMKPVEKAQKLIPLIENIYQNLIETKLETTRIEKKKEELQSWLDSLIEVNAQIIQFKKEEQKLQNNKINLSQKRTVGMFTAILGLVISITSIFFNFYYLILGLPLGLIGLIFAFHSSPISIDQQLNFIRSEREKLLGDKARIDDYSEQLERSQKEEKEQKNLFSTKIQELDQVLSQLPSKPREYRNFLKLDENTINALSSFRSAIQQDIQILTKLSTERSEVSKIANELENHQNVLQKEKTKHKEILDTIKTLNKSKSSIEEEKGITLDQEKELRKTLNNLQNHVQELEITLENALKKASGKERLESELEVIRELMLKIQTEIEERNKNRIKIQEKIKINMNREEMIRTNRDKLKEEFGRLENEKKEREADIQESEKTMKANRELNKDYPSLMQQDETEKFEIESMRRSIKLLEITRDGIVAGVKGRIETHMMRFLPSLTANRYSMCQIDEKDYRIEVFDREAHRWREKGVFSGATQDQFSLSLRLAFALSTIPSSRGARPGFIFLDEPLSGFDSQRRDGLLNLLSGDLSKFFDQIIVISHLEELKNEFTEQIQLEAGEIVQ